uniref:Uncharacterized protein n=1 Tax=Rhizophora mucronata TaxID=61149 RepID=A0A2P2PZ26_RHIMU
MHEAPTLGVLGQGHKYTNFLMSCRRAVPQLECVYFGTQ